MIKLYKLNWAVIFSLSFFASCSLNKSYQGFGGGFHVPQKLQSSMQSESSFKISNHSTDDENNLAIPEFVSSVQTQIIVKDVTRTSNKMNGISNSISLKKLVNPSNVNSNNKQSIAQPSIVKSFNASYKSNSDTGAKVGMWIFRILGYPLAILGFILTLIGLFDRYLGGEPTVYMGLVILTLGLFMLWRAFKISKRLNQNK